MPKGRIEINLTIIGEKECTSKEFAQMHTILSTESTRKELISEIVKDIKEEMNATEVIVNDIKCSEVLE